MLLVDAVHPVNSGVRSLRVSKAVVQYFTRQVTGYFDDAQIFYFLIGRAELDANQYYTNATFWSAVGGQITAQERLRDN